MRYGLALTPGSAARDSQQALELPERVAIADGRRLVGLFDKF